MSGEFKKLTIESYKDIGYGSSDQAEKFVVMFNPASYTQKYEVEYEENQGQGTTGNSQKFGRIKPQEYSFDFVIDGALGEKDKPQDDQAVSKKVDTFPEDRGQDGRRHSPPALPQTCLGKPAIQVRAEVGGYQLHPVQQGRLPHPGQNHGGLFRSDR